MRLAVSSKTGIGRDVSRHESWESTYGNNQSPRCGSICRRQLLRPHEHVVVEDVTASERAG